MNFYIYLSICDLPTIGFHGTVVMHVYWYHKLMKLCLENSVYTNISNRKKLNDIQKKVLLQLYQIVRLSREFTHALTQVSQTVNKIRSK